MTYRGDGRCTCHSQALRALDRCIPCGRPAEPVRGVILERFYPGRTTCTGCGRLQVHCTCSSVARPASHSRGPIGPINTANIRTPVRSHAQEEPLVHRNHRPTASSWTEFGDKSLAAMGSASDDGAAYTPTPEAQP